MSPQAVEPRRRSEASGEPESLPVFGTWGRIYAAVVVWALVVMGLLFLFSRWPY